MDESFFSSGGEDREAEITISLEEAFHGAKKSFALEIAEPDRRGAVRRIDADLIGTYTPRSYVAAAGELGRIIADAGN